MVAFAILKSLFSGGLFFAKSKESQAGSGGDFSEAIFGGGCFWCMQPAFDKVEGVAKTVVGYTGGDKKNPTYEEICSGTTGHYEAIQIFYDAKKVSYKELLKVFWRNIDPSQGDGQFSDVGEQYKSVIFYRDEAQKKSAEESKEELLRSQRVKRVDTLILPAKPFYSAEESHQEYYKKCPFKYQFYRHGSGRDKRLKELWKE